MYCNFCGNQLDDRATYCPKCGSSVSAGQSYDADYITTPYNHGEAESKAVKSLVFGILGLAIGSLLGFIFGIVGKRYAKEYRNMVGTLHGKAKAGNILSSIAIPLGIISFIGNVITIVDTVQKLI